MLIHFFNFVYLCSFEWLPTDFNSRLKNSIESMQFLVKAVEYADVDDVSWQMSFIRSIKRTRAQKLENSYTYTYTISQKKVNRQLWLIEKVS